MSDTHDRPVGSTYLEWIKALPPPRFNLTLSGLPATPLDALPGALDEVALSGPAMYGYEPLKEAIGARYGVPPECVVTAEGTSMANHLVMAALLGPGDEALVEHPWYEPLPALARFLGATVRPLERVPEAGYAVDPEAVARGLTPRTRLVVLTNLHNPSGALIDADTLRAVGEAARRVGARVLVDEVYLDALFEAAPPSAVRLGEPFVVTSSLTKVYGLGGLRCGWVLADAAFARCLWRVNELFTNVGVHVGERLGVVAFRNLDGLAARARAHLDANRAALASFFASRGDLDAGGVPVLGTTAFPRVRSGSADALSDLLVARYETAVVPGRFFGDAGCIRLGLGPAPPVFAEGLERLGAALDDLGRTGA